MKISYQNFNFELSLEELKYVREQGVKELLVLKEEFSSLWNKREEIISGIKGLIPEIESVMSMVNEADHRYHLRNTEMHFERISQKKELNKKL